MKTVGMETSQENGSEEESISKESILKLMGSTREDRCIAVHLLFIKYPKLYDYAIEDNEGKYVTEDSIRIFWPDFDMGDWSLPDYIARGLGLET